MVLPCGICMTATVIPDTISLVMFFFHSYFGNQTRAGKRDNTVCPGWQCPDLTMRFHRAVNKGNRLAYKLLKYIDTQVEVLWDLTVWHWVSGYWRTKGATNPQHIWNLSYENLKDLNPQKNTFENPKSQTNTNTHTHTHTHTHNVSLSLWKVKAFSGAYITYNE